MKDISTVQIRYFSFLGPLRYFLQTCRTITHVSVMSPSVVPGENNGLLRPTTIHNIPKQSKATYNCEKKNKKQSKTIRNYPKHSTTTPNNLLLPIVFVNENHVSERFHWFHDAVQFDFWNGKTFRKSGAFLISTKKHI